MKITEPDSFLRDLWNRFSTLFGTGDRLPQAVIDKCANVRLSNSTDISAVFDHYGGFIKWYNATLSSKPEFAHRGAIGTTGLISDRFNAFWDQIPAIFESTATSGVEFSALMCIGIQENSGDLWS